MLNEKTACCLENMFLFLSVSFVFKAALKLNSKKLITDQESLLADWLFHMLNKDEEEVISKDYNNTYMAFYYYHFSHCQLVNFRVNQNSIKRAVLIFLNIHHGLQKNLPSTLSTSQKGDDWLYGYFHYFCAYCIFWFAYSEQRLSPTA